MRRWMLPDGVEETLPPRTWLLEALRRRLLDCYREAGYDLISPPLIEYLETLFSGSGGELRSRTFKFTDPATGQLLGLRADMTPQAARIASRHYSDQSEIKLCYLGSVLRTQPDDPGGARVPMQVGCEIFASADFEADLTILQMMLRTLSLARIESVHIGLGHAGIYRALTNRMQLSGDDEEWLFDILQRKSHPDLAEFLQPRADAEVGHAFSTLMDMNGDVSVLEAAGQKLPDMPEIRQALDAIKRASGELQRLYPEVGVQIDLAELRGYRYHTGLVFAAFVPGHGREVARGGRYDGVGGEFGRVMPAVGFSADMHELLQLGQTDDTSTG